MRDLIAADLLPPTQDSGRKTGGRSSATSRRFCRPDAGFWAKDAEFRDRSASDMCPIATLRGLLL